METGSPSITTGDGGGLTLRPTLVDRVEYAVFAAVYGLFRRLPLGPALRIGAALGTLAYRLAWRPRRVGLCNLAIAFPEKSEAERRAILRRSCANLGRMLAEFCHLEELEPESVEERVQVEDRSVLERGLAEARERGAILLTAHFGNWELLAYAHGLLGYPITLIHRPMRNRLVNDAIDRVRRRAGTRCIAKKQAAREALRALRRREMVAVPADQNQTRRYGVFVDFFAVAASTTPGPARLAMLTGAPIYPVFLVREGDTERHRLVVLPRVAIAASGDREADIRETTRRCTAVIEEMLRRYPDHWIWFHKRWRTRPPGEPRLY